MDALEVHQFHSGTAEGDAITDEMLSWQGHLRQLGFASEIFAQHIPDALKASIRDIRSYAPTPGATLLLHHSMGHDILDEVLNRPHRVVPVFHNITPLEFIDEPFYRKYAHIGHQQLRRLATVASAAIADSNHNRREMLRAGFERATVIPVRTDFSTFAQSGGPVERSADWLFVGRVVPSKGQLELVEVFANGLSTRDIGQNLVLIGDTSDRSYLAQIQARAANRQVTDRVRILGKVSASELVAAYGAAGLYVSMSKHEGFGVPLLEAMAAGLPVVAYDSAAVGETMAGAGFAVLAHDADGFLRVCTSLQTDPALYEQTVHAQSLRLATLRRFDVAQSLLRVINEANGAPHRTTVQVQGPFETSYSLAILNRQLALALADQPELDVSIYATEGPGDYTPRSEDLALVPAAAALFDKSPSMPYPDVVIRQMYPPRVHDSHGGLTFQYFGWEESLLPQEYVHDFNRHLTGIGVMSSFVKTVLRESGVTVPIDVVGVGVRQPDVEHPMDLDELSEVRSFRFLHISSAFPRKGVDVLLKAFFVQFTGDDDASLILKTFPNPHNEVKALIDELTAQHDNSPHVVWINRDMSEVEIDSLYAAASSYVHPARGEGFGLPVAEAMNACVPVIAPASTGLADFVSDATASTVPFEFTIAQTHLSVPGSMWAEPDAAALGRVMRSAYEHPDDKTVAERALAAKSLIGQQFNWMAVAERFAMMIERERDQVTAPSIAMVSTWNSRCGIAEYSSDLITTAGNDWDAQIYADARVHLIDPDHEEFVSRTWISDPRAPIDTLLASLDESTADIVHVQHNYGFIGLPQLATLIRREVNERAVVVTLHRTENLDTPALTAHIASIADELALADSVIVHQQEDAQRMRALGVERVEVVPIGARQFANIPIEAARQQLGLQFPAGAAVIATYGFLLPHKGTLQLIQAIGLMRDQGRDVSLVAVCALHTDPLSALYERECRDEIDRLGLHESVRLITDFLAPEVSHLLLSIADVIALPYHDSAESSSAALRFVLPVGRAVIASEIGIFHDARDSLHLVAAPPTPARLAAAIVDLLDDADTREEYAMKARRLSHESSLRKSVSEHSRIYRSVTAGRKPPRGSTS